MPQSKSKRRRYQPPPKKKPKPSPRWFGVLVLGLLFAGVLVILAFYGLIPAIPGIPWLDDPAGTHAALLWVGLGLIALGFAAATQWR